MTNANGLGGPARWIELTPQGPLPPGRVSHTAEYDYTNNRLIIFGGNTGSGQVANDVWVLTNANGLGEGAPAWTRLTPTGALPSTRSGHVSLYDQATNRMMIFGGISGLTLLNDIWVLTCANGLSCTPTWQPVSPQGVPPAARSGALAVHNSVSNRLVVWSGSSLSEPLPDL